MQALSSLIEQDQSKFHTRISSKVWDPKTIQTLRTSHSTLKICSTWQMKSVFQMSLQHQGRKSKTASITHKTSKHKTLWVEAVLATNRPCYLVLEEMVVLNSLAVVVNYLTRRERYSQCQLRTRGLELHHRIWTVFWVQTRKQSQTDRWVRSRRSIIISLLLVAQWDQVAVQNQGQIKFEQVDWPEEVYSNSLKRGKLLAAKVQCRHRATVANNLKVWKLLVDSLRSEVMLDRIQRDQITLSLRRTSKSKHIKTLQVEMVYLVLTISCLETMHLDNNKWSCRAIRRIIKEVNSTDLSSIKNSQEAQVLTIG